MRRTAIGAAVILGAICLGDSAHGQTSVNNGGGFSDPFFLYYSWFLPRQQYLTTQAGPELSINARAAARQESVIVDRQALYERVPSLGMDDLGADPLQPFTRQGGTSRLARTSPTGIVSQNLGGTGPPGYYNRGVAGYFPTIRSGRSVNRSLPSIRGGGRRGGSGLVPSATSGMMSGLTSGMQGMPAQR